MQFLRTLAIVSVGFVHASALCDESTTAPPLKAKRPGKADTSKADGRLNGVAGSARGTPLELEEFKPGTLGTRTVIGEDRESYRIYPGSHMQFEGGQPRVDYPGSILFIAEGGLVLNGTRLQEGKIYVINDKNQPILDAEAQNSVWIAFRRNESVITEKSGTGRRLGEVKSGEKVQLLFAGRDAEGWHKIRTTGEHNAEGWVRGESWNETTFMKQRRADRTYFGVKSSVETHATWIAKCRDAKIMMLSIMMQQKHVEHVDATALPQSKGKYGPLAQGRLDGALKLPAVPLSSIDVVTDKGSGEKWFRLKLILFRDGVQQWPAQIDEGKFEKVNLWGLDAFDLTGIQSTLLGSAPGFAGGGTMAFGSYDVFLAGETTPTGSVRGKATGFVSGAKKLPFQDATFELAIFDSQIHSSRDDSQAERIVGPMPHRTWRNREGKMIEAQLIDLQDGKVTLRKKSDGKTYAVPLQNLSEADQQWVNWLGGKAGAQVIREQVEEHDFQKHSHWPALAADLTGPIEVRVRNPNDFRVRVGLRSDGSGKDFIVAANSVSSIRAPNGPYDIYFQYSSDPESLYQGDSFTLRNNGVEIQIVKVVNGNYGIRRVK